MNKAIVFFGCIKFLRLQRKKSGKKKHFFNLERNDILKSVNYLNNLILNSCSSGASCK